MGWWDATSPPCASCAKRWHLASYRRSHYTTSIRQTFGTLRQYSRLLENSSVIISPSASPNPSLPPRRTAPQLRNIHALLLGLLPIPRLPEHSAAHDRRNRPERHGRYRALGPRSLRAHPGPLAVRAIHHPAVHQALRDGRRDERRRHDHPDQGGEPDAAGEEEDGPCGSAHDRSGEAQVLRRVGPLELVEGVLAVQVVPAPDSLPLLLSFSKKNGERDALPEIKKEKRRPK